MRRPVTVKVVLFLPKDILDRREPAKRVYYLAVFEAAQV
jgi:hypothetical protein